MQLPLPWRYGQSKPFGSIPRINWAHPLAQGLSLYCYDVGGVIVDLVSGALFTPTGVTGSRASSIGSGIQFPATGWGSLPQSPGATGLAQTAPFSVAMGTFYNGSPATGCTIICNGSIANDGAAPFAFSTGAGSATTMSAVLANAAFADFTQAIAQNKFQSWGVTATGASASSFYADGKSDSTSVLATTFAQTASRICYSSAQSNAQAFGQGIIGFLPYFAAWNNRALIAADYRSLHDDPYCFLIYPEDEIFSTLVGAAAGGAVVDKNDHFSGKFSPAKFNILSLLRHNVAADFSVAQVQPATNTNFIGKFRPDQIRALPTLWRVPAIDTPVLVVPETNTHFTVRFSPTRFALLPQLSRVESQDTSTAQTQPETNTNFIGKFTPAKFMLLTQLRHNIAADLSSQTQPETNVHFAGKFVPMRFNRLLGLSFNVAADDSAAQTQAETNTHFIGKFRPDQIKLLPNLWRNPALELPVTAPPETGPHFVGRFVPTVFNRLPALNFNVAADSSAPQTQPETNTHHVGKFRPTSFMLMPSLWRNGAVVDPLGVQPETNPHFIGKFRPTNFMLQPSLAWNPAHSTTASVQPSTPVHFIGKFTPDRFTLQKWLRELPATDFVIGPVVHFCPDVTGSMAVYTLTGAMAAYAITGTAVGPNCGVATPGVPADGIDSFTKLMLHMDGADGSTTFNDSSSSARVVTPSGNAQINTAQFVFGGASGLFDGNGDFLTVTSSADLVLTGDFAVDFLVRLSSAGTTRFIFTWNAGGFNFQILVTTLGAIQFSDGVGHTRTGTTLMTLNTWYHGAITRVSGVLRLFINGSQEDTNFSTSSTYGSAAANPRISASGSSALDGFIDEFRISVGNGRWSANFTIPAQAYSAAVPPFSNCPVIGTMAAYSVTGAGTLPRVC